MGIKKIIAGLVGIATAVSAAGCNNNDTYLYKAASGKTDADNYGAYLGIKRHIDDMPIDKYGASFNYDGELGLGVYAGSGNTTIGLSYDFLLKEFRPALKLGPISYAPLQNSVGIGILVFNSRGPVIPIRESIGVGILPLAYTAMNIMNNAVATKSSDKTIKIMFTEDLLPIKLSAEFYEGTARLLKYREKPLEMKELVDIITGLDEAGFTISGALQNLDATIDSGNSESLEGKLRFLRDSIMMQDSFLLYKATISPGKIEKPSTRTVRLLDELANDKEVVDAVSNDKFSLRAISDISYMSRIFSNVVGKFKTEFFERQFTNREGKLQITGPYLHLVYNDAKSTFKKLLDITDKTLDNYPKILQNSIERSLVYKKDSIANLKLDDKFYEGYENVINLENVLIFNDSVSGIEQWYNFYKQVNGEDKELESKVKKIAEKRDKMLKENIEELRFAEFVLSVEKGLHSLAFIENSYPKYDECVPATRVPLKALFLEFQNSQAAYKNFVMHHAKNLKDPAKLLLMNMEFDVYSQAFKKFVHNHKDFAGYEGRKAVDEAKRQIWDTDADNFPKGADADKVKKLLKNVREKTSLQSKENVPIQLQLAAELSDFLAKNNLAGENKDIFEVLENIKLDYLFREYVREEGLLNHFSSQECELLK